MINGVLVVCIGNICRSPMAEGLMKRDAPEIEIASAGLGALVGEPAHPISQELLLQRGVDVSGHRARQLTPELVQAADLVLVMEYFQGAEIERLMPFSRGKVHLLGRWGGFETPDPYRQPRQAFEDALALIERGVRDWTERLGKL